MVNRSGFLEPDRPLVVIYRAGTKPSGRIAKDQPQSAGHVRRAPALRFAAAAIDAGEAVRDLTFSNPEAGSFRVAGIAKTFMPPRLTPFLANYYYHIYNRGVNRALIFFHDANYYYLLRLLKENLSRYAIGITAYCLLPNHYHLLLKPSQDGDLSKMMKSLFGSYTQAVNKQQNRQGPLFQSRFRSILVDKDEYLVHLTRYIHLNPVTAGFVGKPQDWQYSNYLDIIGQRTGSLKDISIVPERFPDGITYKKFVEDDLAETKHIHDLEKYLLE
jgi:putative transposase